MFVRAFDTEQDGTIKTNNGQKWKLKIKENVLSLQKKVNPPGTTGGIYFELNNE